MVTLGQLTEEMSTSGFNMAAAGLSLHLERRRK